MEIDVGLTKIEVFGSSLLMATISSTSKLFFPPLQRLVHSYPIVSPRSECVKDRLVLYLVNEVQLLTLSTCIYPSVCICRVAFRKLRKGGQICEQGSFEGAACTRQTRGSGGMLSQKMFEKRNAPRSILVHFWPCITCIISVHVYPY